MLVLLMYHHPDLNPHDTWFEKGKSFSFDSLKVYNIHTVYIYIYISSLSRGYFKYIE